MEFEQASLWLTLVGPSSPLPVASWWQLDSWVPFAGHLGSSWLSPQEDVAHAPVHKFEESERKIAKQIHALSRRVDQSLADRLRVPLQRLNQSLRRKNPADQSIDLGITLESLLLTDREPSELAFQFRLRGAWLIGKDSKDREKIFDTLQSVYTYRSIAAHTGILLQKVRGHEPGEILKEGSELAVRIILNVAQNGIPDWTGVVLGAGSGK